MRISTLWLTFVAVLSLAVTLAADGAMGADNTPPTKAQELADNWPKTLGEAVDKVAASLSQEDRRRVVSTETENLIDFHFGWGTGIRNAFGLWAGNTALLESCGSREMHPDNASTVIIEAVWKRLRAEADPAFLKQLEKMHSTAKAIMVPGADYHWARIEKAVADMNAAASTFRTRHKGNDRYAPLRVEIAGAVTPDWPVVFENRTDKPVSIYDLLSRFARSHGFEIIYDYPVARIYREKK